MAKTEQSKRQKAKAKARLDDIQAKAAAQPVKPDPNEIITFRGWKMTRYTAAAIKVWEEALGFELTILQGPFNSSVGASAGTHDEDGVIDLAPAFAVRKCRAGRANHWVNWIRPVNWDGNGGSKHLHAVLETANVAPLAAKQRDVDYPNHDNGLAGHARDNFPYHPEVERFNYAHWWHDELLDRKIAGLDARINKLRDQLSAARARRKMLRAKKRSK